MTHAKAEQFTKVNRPRWSGARQGFPEPSVVVPPSGELNRAQRRAQGRYRGFLDGAPKILHVARPLLRRSGPNGWSKKAIEKIYAQANVMAEQQV